MVSTRHSAGPGETLVSLETVKSPSPRKRKLDQETPDQKFVDARATPFEQRTQTGTRWTRIGSDLDSIEGHESVVDAIAESDVDVVTPSLAARPPTAQTDTNSLRIASLDEDVSDSDEDDAPEVISNLEGAKTAKAVEENRLQTLRDQDEKGRERRRQREARLQEQRKAKRAKTIVPNSAEGSGPSAEQKEDRLSTEDARLPMPRFLPEEILHAAPSAEATSSDSLVHMRPSHQRFEPKKEQRSVQKGPLTVQVLTKARRDLAPKQVASIANTKAQWLYQRGQNKVMRRPIKKPLA